MADGNDSRRKARNSAIVLGCVAVALYVAFIVFSVTRGS
jgi:hypothetical protein